LGSDVALAWKLLEQEVGDTSEDLAGLYSHFDWVLRRWRLSPAITATLEPLNALIGKELVSRGYDGRAIRSGSLIVTRKAQRAAEAKTSGKKNPQKR